MIPGITPDIGGQAADAKRVAEAEEGRPLSAREVSAHFARKAWAWIRVRARRRGRSFREKDPIRPLPRRGAAELQLPVVPRAEPRPEAARRRARPPRPACGRGFRPRALRLGGAVAPRAPRLGVVRAGVRPLGGRVLRRDALPAAAPRGARRRSAGRAVAQLPEAWRTREARGLWSAAATAAAPRGRSRSGRRASTTARADEDMHWALYLIEKGDAAEAARSPDAAAPTHPRSGSDVVPDRAGVGGGRAHATTRSRRSRRHARSIRILRRRSAGPAAAHESRGVDRVLARDALGALAGPRGCRRARAGGTPACLLNLAAVLAEKGDRAGARALAEQRARAEARLREGRSAAEGPRR